MAVRSAGIDRHGAGRAGPLTRTTSSREGAATFTSSQRGRNLCQRSRVTDPTRMCRDLHDTRVRHHSFHTASGDCLLTAPGQFRIVTQPPPPHPQAAVLTAMQGRHRAGGRRAAAGAGAAGAACQTAIWPSGRAASGRWTDECPLPRSWRPSCGSSAATPAPELRQLRRNSGTRAVAAPPQLRQPGCGSSAATPATGRTGGRADGRADGRIGGREGGRTGGREVVEFIHRWIAEMV